MPRDTLGDLMAFMAVARERSFTRAAARLGVSQSALSHTMRGLESRLGVRLLTRTTRSVSPTDAGLRLIERVGPRLEEIEAEIDALGALRDKPAGTVRLTCSDHAANTILLPKLADFLPRYPDIHVEIVVDYGLTNIVAERYDAGVRYGEQVEKDMIAVRVGPDARMATVAAPAYFSRHPKPVSPHDLTEHVCINIRLPTYGGLYAWEYEKNGRALNVRVTGQVIVNGLPQTIGALIGGLGIAHVPEDAVRPLLAEGKLVRVLEDWCPSFPGFYLYYPSRRQPSPAFSLLVEALRYRA